MAVWMISCRLRSAESILNDRFIVQLLASALPNQMPGACHKQVQARQSLIGLNILQNTHMSGYNLDLKQG